MRDKEIKQLLDNNECDHGKGGKMWRNSSRRTIIKREDPIGSSMIKDAVIIGEKMIILEASSQRFPNSRAAMIPRLIWNGRRGLRTSSTSIITPTAKR